jgi:hypothetical protein
MSLRSTILAAALTVATPLAVLPFASNATAAGSSPTLCGTPTVVPLLAGQTNPAGTVEIANDRDDNLYIEFDITAPWMMDQSHVAIADTLAGIPQTRKGNPMIGNFAYQRTHIPAVTSDTYVIPRSALSLDVNGSVVVAAHAALSRLDAAGQIVASETGWAAGQRFAERGSWATYLSYEFQTCSDEPPVVETSTQTAFARSDESSTCFLDIDVDGNSIGDFNRWGWTNGPLMEGDYVMPLYAGAGQCDVRKGTLVGSVSVSYHQGTAVVSFRTTGQNPSTGQPYTMADAHAYVGPAILPTKNGEYTVAPGQYPQIDSEVANATAKTFTFSGLSGAIYVVAHSSVAGF